MTRHKFSNLKLDSKAALLFEKRQFISSRYFSTFEISLYLVNGLFVEVWFSLINNEIERIETASFNNLALYLLDLEIHDLFD
jgi:hypothetical protein